jgi:hypothetical protein
MRSRNQLDQVFQCEFLGDKPQVNAVLKINNRVADVIGSLYQVGERMPRNSSGGFLHFFLEVPVHQATSEKTVFFGLEKPRISYRQYELRRVFWEGTP